MRIYNTKTLQLEEFKPIVEGEVSMYVCGPTVYNDIHIGNARPIVVFDTLRRVFEALGYKVKYVSNYTDVDDKIINEAEKRNISEHELTEEMIRRVEDIRHQLNAKELYRTPKVTETMDDIIKFIEALVDNGSAYVKDGDVFFRTSSVEDYGSLSNQKIDDLKVGARIEENDKKESPLDFVLWKKTDKGIKWKTKFSVGRPGWHTECVVMINKELGPVIDIHGGGKDLKFPHHENERAQACSLCHSPLANYWMHNGMIDIEGVKMSKSLGNFITAKDALAMYDPMVIRWLLLSAQYRADLNVSDEIIKNSETELNKVLTALKQAELKLELASYHSDELEQTTYDRFIAEMSDDMNTPNAYSVIFDIVKQINQALRVREIDYANLAKLTNTLNKALYILGISHADVKLSDEDKELYAKWTEAKQAKDFAQADVYRDELKNRGIL